MAGLYGALERVKVHLPADLKTPSNWEQLAPQIAGHDAVLAVVAAVLMPTNSTRGSRPKTASACGTYLA